MWNAGLDEAQGGIKIAGRNINNLRYADDTDLMAESEEKLKGTDIQKNTVHWCICQASTFNKILSIVILVANLIPSWEICMQFKKQQLELDL